MVARETRGMEIEGRVPSPGVGQGCAAWGHAAYSRRRGTVRRSLAPPLEDEASGVPRCGAPTDDSPPRERWVLRAQRNQPRTGRQIRPERPWRVDGCLSLRTPFGVRALLHTFSPGRRVRANPGLSAETPSASGIWELGTGNFLPTPAPTSPFQRRGWVFKLRGHELASSGRSEVREVARVGPYRGRYGHGGYHRSRAA